MFRRNVNHLLTVADAGDVVKANEALRAADEEFRDLLRTRFGLTSSEFDARLNELATAENFGGTIELDRSESIDLSAGEFLPDDWPEMLETIETFPDSDGEMLFAPFQHESLVRDASQAAGPSPEDSTESFDLKPTPADPESTEPPQKSDVKENETTIPEKRRCFCNNCGPTQVCETDGVCFAGSQRNENGQLEYFYRCLSTRELQPQVKPLVCLNTTPNGKASVCCHDADFCNRDLRPALPPIASDGTPSPFVPGQAVWIMAVLVPLTLVAMILIGVSLYYAKRRKQRRMLDSGEGGESEPMILPPGNIRDFMDMTTSGSGSGLPLLVQRSIARQITLLETIGKGRFGEVWRGRWRGEHVAVKIFSTRDERSWFREVEIYQTVMLRHDNILGFIAADNKDNGTWTQLWLVTDYHEHGSLFDYLMEHAIDPYTLNKMALSIANGLAHLHIEIIGTQGKPAIAHRDIKSRNILVKSDLSCAVADLGLAVRYDSTTRSIDIPPNSRVGTRRYLSPEILNDSIAMHHFDSFKSADIYALGLVFWELCRRCTLVAEEYQLPFFDVVAPDPTIEEMKKVVCDDKMRPPIPPTWNACQELSALSKIMLECWYENPTARLTALRIKKSISQIGNDRSSQSDSSNDVKA